MSAEPNEESGNTVTDEVGIGHQEVYIRRASLTASINQGIRNLQSLYARTSTLFFGCGPEDKGGCVDGDFPKMVTLKGGGGGEQSLEFNNELSGEDSRPNTGATTNAR